MMSSSAMLKNEYIFFATKSTMEKLLSFIALFDGAVLIGAGSSCLPNQDCFIVVAAGICILVALFGYGIFRLFVNYLEAKEHARYPSSPSPSSPLSVKRHNLPLSSSPNNPSRIQEIRVQP